MYNKVLHIYKYILVARYFAILQNWEFRTITLLITTIIFTQLEKKKSSSKHVSSKYDTKTTTEKNADHWLTVTDEDIYTFRYWTWKTEGLRSIFRVWWSYSKPNWLWTSTETEQKMKPCSSLLPCHDTPFPVCVKTLYWTEAYVLYSILCFFVFFSSSMRTLIVS